MWLLAAPKTVVCHGQVEDQAPATRCVMEIVAVSLWEKKTQKLMEIVAVSQWEKMTQKTKTRLRRPAASWR